MVLLSMLLLFHLSDWRGRMVHVLTVLLSYPPVVVHLAHLLLDNEIDSPLNESGQLLHVYIEEQHPLQALQVQVVVN